jgi:hypothetical protein
LGVTRCGVVWAVGAADATGFEAEAHAVTAAAPAAVTVPINARLVKSVVSCFMAISRVRDQISIFSHEKIEI